LLLIGSASFSYLAWSQSGPGAQLLKMLPQLPEPASATIPPSQSTPLNQASVHALRIENRKLQLRIAQLQAGIENDGP
jgi:hypothetical protein